MNSNEPPRLGQDRANIEPRGGTKNFKSESLLNKKDINTHAHIYMDHVMYGGRFSHDEWTECLEGNWVLSLG